MSELLGKIVIIKRNGSDGVHFPLRTRECLFGRNQDCDIRIQLASVSKEHAKISVDDNGKIWITNLSSCNQTLVNGKPVLQPLEVNHLDIFTITDRSFRFEFPVTPEKEPRPSKSPQVPKRQRSGTPLQLAQQDFTPTMPIKGSPRTPATGGNLKENIRSLRRKSVPVREEEEAVASSAVPAPLLHPSQDINSTSTKRKSVASDSARRSSKRVSFGPVLSPEQFHKELPPITPVKRGATPHRLSSDLKPLLASHKKRRSIISSPLDVPIEEMEEAQWGEKNPSTPENTRVGNKSPDITDELLVSPETLVSPECEKSCVEEVEPTDICTEVIVEEAKKRLATPIRKDIEQGVKLRETKKRRATPNTVEGQKQREAKKRMATPMRKEIEGGWQLRQTKNKMPTPMRKEIEEGPKLRETKKKMATPMRKEIEEKPKLRETKKKMATPMRKEIEEGLKLRDTKKKMATPMRKEIEEKPKLRETKKKMATPMRKEIEEGPKLRETKKKMATPMRKEIEEGPKLRETKKKMATPMRKEIEEGVRLCKTKKVMNQDLQDSIRNGVTLKETKKVMPLEMQISIIKGKELNKTKKSLPTPLKAAITAGKTLRKSKKSMKTPLKQQIWEGVQLRETRLALKSDRDEAPANPTKTPRKQHEDITKETRTSVQRGLLATKRRIATPLRRQIQSKPTLRAVRRKSSSVVKPKKPTYADVLKRHLPVRRRSCKSSAARKSSSRISVAKQTESHRLSTKASSQDIVSTSSNTDSCAPNSPEKTTKSTSNVDRQTRSWLGSLSVATHGARERSTPAGDLVGLSEMFASPPVTTKQTPKAKVAPSKWLASLGRATAAPKACSTTQDLEGVPEMFTTPPVKDQETDVCTPITVIKPVAPSYTPSLRKAQLDIHAVEAIAPSTTPSLRSACKVTRASFPESPIIDSFHLELPESPLEFIDAPQPSTTPSLRSPSKANTKTRKSVSRNSVDYRGITRLLRTPKTRSNPVDAADNYVAEMFHTPSQEPVQSTASAQSARSPAQSRKSVNLEGLTRLLSTPKTPRDMYNAEDNFQPEMFTSPQFSPAQNEQEVNDEVYKKRPFAKHTPASKKTAEKPRNKRAAPVNASNTEPTKTAEETEKKTTLVSEPRTTRNKRAAPVDASITEPTPKRTRRTRAVNTKQELQTAEPPVRNTRSRSKPQAPGVVQTPTPLVFKRSALEPITEVETPLASPYHIRETTTLKDSPMLEVIKEQEVAKPKANRRNAKSSKTTSRPRRNTRITQEPEQPVDPVPSEKPIEEDKPKTTHGTRASRATQEPKQLVDPVPSEKIIEEDKPKTTRGTRASRATKEPKQVVDPVPSEKTIEEDKPKTTRGTRASRRKNGVIEESDPTSSTQIVCEANEPAVLIRTRTRSRAKEPQPVKEVTKPDVTKSRNSRTKETESSDGEPTEQTNGRRTRATAKTVSVPDKVAEPKRTTRKRPAKNKQETVDSSTKGDLESVNKKRETRAAKLADKEANVAAQVEQPRTRRGGRSVAVTKKAEEEQLEELHKKIVPSARRGRSAEAPPARVTSRGQKRGAPESVESKPPAAKKTRAEQKKAVAEVAETRQTRQSVRRSTRSRK